MSPIVLIGGGKGTVQVIRAFKPLCWMGVRLWDLLRIICNMSDDGGSTGRILQDRGGSPWGDIRNVLVSLAPDGLRLADLFDHRFEELPAHVMRRMLSFGPKKLDLTDESVGNFMLKGLEEITGGPEPAIREASRMLDIRGMVLPCCLERLKLMGRDQDDHLIQGQSRISHDEMRKSRISQLWLEVHHETEGGFPVANQAAVKAIEQAALIVIGPGALHASLLAAMIVPDIIKALAASPAFKVYFLNTAIKLKETEGFGPEDHVRAILHYVYGITLNLVVVNNRAVELPSGKSLLTWGEDTICGIPVLAADLIDESDIEGGSYYLHDSEKISPLLFRKILPGILKER